MAKPTYKRLVTFKMDAALPLSIIPSTAKNILTAYPNPTKDFINVEFPNYSHKNLIIKNLAGKVIYTHEITELDMKLNISMLDKGIYVLSSIGNSVLKKILIIN